jgi:hypothetical protein
LLVSAVPRVVELQAQHKEKFATTLNSPAVKSLYHDSRYLSEVLHTYVTQCRAMFAEGGNEPGLEEKGKKDPRIDYEKCSVFLRACSLSASITLLQSAWRVLKDWDVRIFVASWLPISHP